MDVKSSFLRGVELIGGRGNQLDIYGTSFEVFQVLATNYMVVAGIR